ncbi:hypothetical protein L083_3965 [Actinoplanes sp. N902-109]|nr:hypothetical protein L083_3965 [Actinoplanes sp. N902-109]
MHKEYYASFVHLREVPPILRIRPQSLSARRRFCARRPRPSWGRAARFGSCSRSSTLLCIDSVVHRPGRAARLLNSRRAGAALRRDR